MTDFHQLFIIDQSEDSRKFFVFQFFRQSFNYQLTPAGLMFEEPLRNLACSVVPTGPTEAAGAAPFFDEFGSSVWRIDGERCEPVW